MKFTLKKTPTFTTKEYRTYRVLRWMNILSLIFIISMTLISGWFVYTKIYQTIGKTETILLIKSNPHFEPINFNLYDRTMTQWHRKMDTRNLDISRDPFYDQTLLMPTSTIDILTTSTPVLIPDTDQPHL